MVTLFDLHVHTSIGSGDSILSPEDMVQEAEKLGLRGLCITEHSGPWDLQQFSSFSDKNNLVLIRGMEVDTNMGHVLAYGLDKYHESFRKADLLRKELDRLGGFMISAHPFRHLSVVSSYKRPLLYLESSIPNTVEEAASHPIFQLVDAIESANGATIDQDNEFAGRVTTVLGLKSTGGSDAHSSHEVGRCVTVFESDICTEEQFYNALNADAFYPAKLLPSGQLKRIGS